MRKDHLRAPFNTKDQVRCGQLRILICKVTHTRVDYGAGVDEATMIGFILPRSVTSGFLYPVSLISLTFSFVAVRVPMHTPINFLTSG